MTPFILDNEGAALQARADLLAGIGRWREAIPLLQSALRFGQDDVKLYCRMARAHLEIGNIAQATKSAERALALNPTDEWSNRLRCAILLKGCNTRRILHTAEEAAAHNPNSLMSLRMLTQALLRANKLDRARETAERLRCIAPNSSEAHEALVLVALKQQRWLDAERHCRAMLTIDPLSSVAFNNLGLALRFSGRKPEAIQSFLEAQRLNPGHSAAHKTLKSAECDHLFGGDLLFYLIVGAGLCIFFALLPLGNRATYGPVWVHAVLFSLAPLLVGGAGLLIRHRLKELPPAARQHLFPKKKRKHDF